MSDIPAPSNPERSELIERQQILDGFFQVEKLRLRHTLGRAGKWSPPLDRFLLYRPDAVCAVVYHRERRSLLFVRQFRVGSFQKDDGWMTELAAGLVDPGETPREAVLRELDEELGFRPQSLRQVRSFYTSPGILDERIFMFYAEVGEQDRVGKGGGRDEEHEDLEIIEVPADGLSRWMTRQDLLDAKTIVGIQWFLTRSSPVTDATA
ncbi:MAG: NUDIX hydrolase [Saprospiraceae bacterium]|nr:NUDIX hydrolase [Saprospiraceae bacterium]